MKWLSICILFVTLLSSCKDWIEGKLKNTRQEMISEKEEIRQQHFQSYDEFRDNVRFLEYQSFYGQMQATDLLIDSVLALLSQSNSREIYYRSELQRLLATGPLGERIRINLNLCFDKLRDFSKRDKQKYKLVDSIGLNAMRSNVVGTTWQQRFFGSSDELGASIILNSFQQEVYKAAMITIN